MTTPTLKQLHQFILDCFSEDELDLFCLEYFGEALNSFGSGMSKAKKALELVLYCQRRAVMDGLLAALEKEREKVFREIFSHTTHLATVPPPVYTPQPRNPKQVFISHSSVDADRAHQIAHDLQANGYDIFITPHSIHPGEKWGPAIERGLNESGIFMVLLTPDAVTSAWVNIETYAAIELANKGEMRLLFLDVKPCQPPILWRQWQFASFLSADYRQNLEVLLHVLGGIMTILQPASTPPPVQVSSIMPETPVSEVKESTVRQCAGITRTGSRCRNLALTNSNYCGIHTPKLVVGIDKEKGTSGHSQAQNHRKQIRVLPEKAATPAPSSPVEKDRHQQEIEIAVRYQQLTQAQTSGDWLNVLTLATQIEMMWPDYQDVTNLKLEALQQLQKPAAQTSSEQQPEAKATISEPQNLETRTQQLGDSPASATIVKAKPIKRSATDSNTFLHEKTGLEFVRVPEGEFIYSHTRTQTESQKEVKQRVSFLLKKIRYETQYENIFREGKLYLPEFWISKTPVTNAAYQQFITANSKHDVPYVDQGWAKPYNWDIGKRIHPANRADHPVVLVSWYDAAAFCGWADLQLPTEEQWEKAARGTDGRTYPWGNNEPTYKLCNFNKNVGGTTIVGQYSPQGDSPYGCVDMSGNVWEWCLNKYDKPDITTFDKSSDLRVLRGGSSYFVAGIARTTSRGYELPDYRGGFGFRVVLVRPFLSSNSRENSQELGRASVTLVDKNLDQLTHIDASLTTAVVTSSPAPEILLPRQERESISLTSSPEPKVNSFVHKITGLEFVRIPAGEFLYGDYNKILNLPEYWISRTPVTQAVYLRFTINHPKVRTPYGYEDSAKPYSWKEKKYPSDKAAHPVVLVSWVDAVVFCEWAGLQLPTEEQWEKAARGTDGRKYPWGDNHPTDKLCNFNKYVGGTTAVGHYSPHGDSPYGCADMCGNVWEWCLNKYNNPADTTKTGSFESHGRRVVRGCSWDFNLHYAPIPIRFSYLESTCNPFVGFRVVARRPPSQ